MVKPGRGMRGWRSPSVAHRRNKQRHVDWQLLHLAGEIRRVVDAAAAVVARYLRIYAQRPGPDGLTIHDTRGHQLVGSNAGFDPFDHRRGCVEHVGTDSAAAVEH